MHVQRPQHIIVKTALCSIVHAHFSIWITNIIEYIYRTLRKQTAWMSAEVPRPNVRTCQQKSWDDRGRTEEMSQTFARGFKFHGRLTHSSPQVSKRKYTQSWQAVLLCERSQERWLDSSHTTLSHGFQDIVFSVNEVLLNCEQFTFSQDVKRISLWVRATQVRQLKWTPTCIHT